MTSKMAQGGAWLAACLASGAGMAFASDAGMPDCAGVAGARVDLVQGQVTPVVKGLSMANGVVRAPDGSYYASDNLALSLDRVSPSGVVQRKWLNLNSNGLALSRDGRTLFVNQFMPAATNSWGRLRQPATMRHVICCPRFVVPPGSRCGRTRV